MRGLYIITDEILTPYSKIETLVEQSLKGSAKIVQFRDKNSSYKEAFEVAKKLKNLTKSYGATFIINDNIKLAIELDCDGVHIGLDDGELKEAKKDLKDKIVGVSCYNDLERAKKLASLGADYVAFGAFFKSSTKPNAPLAQIETLKEAKRVLNVPVCTIGGITLPKAQNLVTNGADMLAVISDIWKSENIEKQSREYSKLWKR